MGTETTVVNIRVQSCEVYIGRGSKWGNPFKIGSDGTRFEVIAKYEKWIRKNKDLMSCLHELKGKSLGCYCEPLPCHGSVLKNLADNLDE